MMSYLADTSQGSMGPDAKFHLEIALVVAMALLIVAVVVLASGGGACEGDGSGDAAAGAVHAADNDVESTLGDVTLMTYEQAATGKEMEKGEQCAICLSEYGEGGERVRVVPACGHFFHAGGVDGWLRARRTCPLCRAGLWPPPPLPRMIRPLPPLPLPRMARPECPPMPPRTTSR